MNRKADFLLNESIRIANWNALLLLSTTYYQLLSHSIQCHSCPALTLSIHAVFSLPFFSLHHVSEKWEYESSKTATVCYQIQYLINFSSIFSFTINILQRFCRFTANQLTATNCLPRCHLPKVQTCICQRRYSRQWESWAYRCNVSDKKKGKAFISFHCKPLFALLQFVKCWKVANRPRSESWRLEGSFLLWWPQRANGVRFQTRIIGSPSHTQQNNKLWHSHALK